VVIELQMARIKQEVNIGLEPYLGVVRDSRSLNDCDYLVQSRGALFEHLVWWGEALKAARQRMAAESGQLRGSLSRASRQRRDSVTGSFGAVRIDRAAQSLDWAA